MLSRGVKASLCRWTFFYSRVMWGTLSAFEEQWCLAFCFVQGLDREAMENALARAEMRARTPSAKMAARAVRSLKKKIARIAELEGRQDSGKALSADQVGRLTTMVARTATFARPPNPKMLPGGTTRNHEKHVKNVPMACSSSPSYS